MSYIGSKPANKAITSADIEDNAVTSAKIDTDTIAAGDLAANSVDSSELVDGSIDTSHLGALQVTTAKLAADAVDGTKLADDAVDSEHYTDASIDNAHLADDAVGVAELSATGTASSSTFLRGDNSWVAAGGDLSFGGDTFGADKSIGSNDDYAFNLEQNGTDRLKFFNNGTRYQAVFTGHSSAGSTDNKTVIVYGTAGGGGCIRCNIDATGNTSHIGFSNPNGGVGWIGTNGSATAYYTSSDYRLKENETAITDGIDRVKQLKPYKFNFKANNTEILDGFFAHEVSGIVPEAISGEKDAVDDEGNIKTQAIDQAKLVPLLTSALQEAITKIETLEAKVTALENA